ncbi:probable methyltransferase-like protein 25 [Haliotis cracherodii]|uniref:probable methyltransferase-like protein 25 n=1 Tax=Haliotis cracherodii TaxID=6455 RepID=UPI0039EB8DBB
MAAKSNPKPDGGVTGGSRKAVINNTKVMLYKSWSFLAEYLPLANSQASDFIVKNLWSFYVPENIQEELLEMSDDELSSLPSVVTGKVMSEGYGVTDCNSELLNAEQTKVNAKAEEKWESFNPGQHHLKRIKCQFLEKSPMSVEGRKNVHLQTLCPISWNHSNLHAFTQAAKDSTLTSMNVLTAAGDVSVLRCGVDDDDDDDDDRLERVLMSQKKSHEVEVMAEVCAHMADVFNTNLTVDLGSGKGYLSTQLCYEFNHHVIGIDSSSTNTEGATKRAGRLDKEWGARKKQPVKSKKNSQRHEGHPSNFFSDKSTRKDFKTKSSSFESKCSSCDINELSDSFIAFNVHDVDGAMEDTLHAENADIKPSDQTTHDHCSTSKNVCPKKVFENTVRINKYRSINNELSVADNTSNSSVEHSESLCNSESTEKHKCSQSSLNNSSTLGIHSTTKDRPKEERFVPLTKFVDCNMKLMESVKESVVELGLDPDKARMLLTGLHTCGGLGSSLLRLFVNSPSVAVMCNVACCYHLLEEELVAGPFGDDASAPCVNSDFPMSSYLQEGQIGLGKAARNIACLSVHRMAAEKQLQGQSFYARALLEKIIHDLVGDVEYGGRKLRKLDKRSKSLYDYVVKAFTRLGLPTDKVTPGLVEGYDSRYSHVRQQLAAFVQLRAVLAPCIESLILLDRYLYLLEQDNIQDVYLTQLFDPVVSPRCFAIIATKKTS